MQGTLGRLFPFVSIGYTRSDPDKRDHSRRQSLSIEVRGSEAILYDRAAELPPDDDGPFCPSATTYPNAGNARGGVAHSA